MRLENAQHEEFCQQWIIDFNGARAARKSGFSKKTARIKASQLLTKINIQERIAELMKDRSERTKVTQDMVLRELAILGFSDFTEFASFAENVGLVIKDTKKVKQGKTRAIKSMKQTLSPGGGSIAIKLHNKEKALELIGKHLGMYPTSIVGAKGEDGEFKPLKVIISKDGDKPDNAS